MTSMNPEVKARWVAALRSGEYEQGHDRLRIADQFCCLGVLCDLAREDHPEWIWAAGGVFMTNPDDDFETATLPAAVVEWAGLEDNNPDIGEIPLAAHNDGIADGSRGPRPFTEIADLIEEHL